MSIKPAIERSDYRPNGSRATWPSCYWVSSQRRTKHIPTLSVNWNRCDENKSTQSHLLHRRCPACFASKMQILKKLRRDSFTMSCLPPAGYDDCSCRHIVLTGSRCNFSTRLFVFSSRKCSRWSFWFGMLCLSCGDAAWERLTITLLRTYHELQV